MLSTGRYVKVNLAYSEEPVTLHWRYLDNFRVYYSFKFNIIGRADFDADGLFVITQIVLRFLLQWHYVNDT